MARQAAEVTSDDEGEDTVMINHIYAPKRGGSALKALAAILFVAAASFAPSFAFAHGGEDHGDETTAVPSSSGPRIDANSHDFELIGIPSARDGGKLVIHLDHFLSNEPVTGASIEMTRGDDTVAATETKGVYVFKTPWVTTPGHYDLTFSITAGEKSDLLIGSLDIPAPLLAKPGHETLWDHIVPRGTALPDIPPWMLVGTLGLAVLLSLLTVKGPRRIRTAFALAAAVTGTSTVAMAAVILTNGTRQADITSATGVAALDLADTSRRLDSGAVFMPKPTQRLLGVATVEAPKAESVHKTVRLIGQVVPDPNRSGVSRVMTCETKLVT